MDVMDRYVEVEAASLDDLIELSYRAVDYVRSGIPDALLADCLKGAVAQVAAHRHEAR